MNEITDNMSDVSTSQSLIKRIQILGLQSEKDVDIKFTSNVTVLIADNGVGKTTVLNTIYSVLSGRLHRLRRLEFETIIAEFSDGSSINIPSQSVQPAFDLDIARRDPRIRRLLSRVPEWMILQLWDETRGMMYVDFRRHPIAREILEITGMMPRSLYEALDSPREQEQLEFPDHPSMEQLREKIGKSFPCDILYFPTYRRIEEDLETLGFERKGRARAEGLIQFGMVDVQARLDHITDQIKSSSVDWYSQINGQMLSQLVDGIKVDNATRESIQERQALQIVLDRIGEYISVNTRQHIIELVGSNAINENRYDALVYFLSNLIKIYDKQKELDNSIKEFTRVCNKYLVEKEVVYHESKVEISIVQKRNKKIINLANLSSGEKQIVSLFSRLYLEPVDTFAVLFDEPELSLSIEWQRMLLPDIMDSGRCNFLLATTHSPFIFENELDIYARDLSEFISYNDHVTR